MNKLLGRTDELVTKCVGCKFRWHTLWTAKTPKWIGSLKNSLPYKNIIFMTKWNWIHAINCMHIVSALFRIRIEWAHKYTNKNIQLNSPSGHKFNTFICHRLQHHTQQTDVSTNIQIVWLVCPWTTNNQCNCIRQLSRHHMSICAMEKRVQRFWLIAHTKELFR